MGIPGIAGQWAATMGNLKEVGGCHDIGLAGYPSAYPFMPQPWMVLPKIKSVAGYLAEHFLARCSYHTKGGHR